MKSDQFEKQIEDEKVEGWKLKDDGDEKVVMMKPNYGSLGGHVLVALLTIWWTLGLGNVLYAAYKYWGDSDKKVVRDESPKSTTTGPTATGATGADPTTADGGTEP